MTSKSNREEYPPSGRHGGAVPSVHYLGGTRLYYSRRGLENSGVVFGQDIWLPVCPTPLRRLLSAAQSQECLLPLFTPPTWRRADDTPFELRLLRGLGGITLLHVPLPRVHQQPRVCRRSLSPLSTNANPCRLLVRASGMRCRAAMICCSLPNCPQGRIRLRRVLVRLVFSHGVVDDAKHVNAQVPACTCQLRLHCFLGREA